MRKVALSVGLTSGTTIKEIVRICAETKRSSTYGIWIGEDLRAQRDVFVLTHLLMRHAPGKTVGIGVASAFAWNVTTMARAAHTLSQAHPTRFRLGIGVGGLQDLQRMGLKITQPFWTLQTTVEVLHKIWADEIITRMAGSIELHRYQARYLHGTGVPIYLGVRGPHLLRLAGRMADGVILSGPLPYLRKAIEIILNQKRHRISESDPRIVVWLPTLLIEKETDLALARKVAATVIADTPMGVLEMARLGDDVRHLQEAARKHGYAYATRLISDDLLDQFTISGDEEHLLNAYRCLANLGIEEIVFGPPYGRKPITAIRKTAEMWDSI
jgi:5,10-methylenetetrahydromethanopterin reductase